MTSASARARAVHASFLLLAALVMAWAPTAIRADEPPSTVKAVVPHPNFDWSEWRRLPVQHDGRVKPLDTLADEIVNVVSGRSKWVKPEIKEGPASFTAPELIYCWLTRPDEWIDQPIIRCEYQPLRKIMSSDKVQVPVEGTFVSLNQVFDWKESKTSGRPVLWSKQLQEHLTAIQTATRAPDTVGETADERALNGKVAELFRHLEAFIAVREAHNLFVVPGLDPRSLTRQTNPEERINAWIPLGVLLNPEKTNVEDDITVAAVMAANPRELAQTLLLHQFPDGHPNEPQNILPILPQLAQAQKVKSPLQVEIRGVKQALDKTREAYDAGDATAFSSAMHGFVMQIRGLARAMESARAEMTPPAKNSIDFGEIDGRNLNEAVWSRFEPLPLSPSQMRVSAYPQPGSTDLEITYNTFQPFRSAWAIFLVALVTIVLAGMMKSSRAFFAAGLLVTLAAIAYSAWGFGMRIAIAGRPPVTNMYETIIWSSFIVSILGFWFCVLPFLWPGLSWSWRLAGVPIRPRNAGGTGIELDRLSSEDQQNVFAGAHWPIRIAASVVRLSLFAATVWFFTRSGTSFRIIELAPPLVGKGIAWASLGTWMVGITTVTLAAWFGSRAAVTLALLPATGVPSARRQPGNLWDQTFHRRYFLLGALPVACFGMMLAHFVGFYAMDILNPRIGSITAVLRNNYWLAIHVLTIVSSYGAGALAWGLGNLAMLFYLFGKYRHEGASPAAVATSAQSGPVFDLDATYGSQEPSLSKGLKKAGAALKPAMISRSLKAGLKGLGTGDRALESAQTRPAKEVATLASYTYKGIQVAVLLLAAGTILGGLWADVSWGRFWDWDPKEVWALISLLAYLVVLHGRYAGWIGTFGTNAGGVLAFMAILFSWYGVNFVLPMVHGWLTGTGMSTEVGLHSYAVGAGGLGYVATGVLLNLALVVAAWARYSAETTDLLSRHQAEPTPQGEPGT